MRLTLGPLLVVLAASPSLASASFTGLGDLPGGAIASFARDVSADGQVVVGHSESASGTEAFRWTATGGLVGLGDLAGGTFFSDAHAASADGSVIVGGSDSGLGAEAFRYTLALGMVGLNPVPLTLDGITGGATGVSGDGSLVVGSMFPPTGSSCFLGDAFTWTASGGLVNTCTSLPVSFLNQVESRRVSTDGSSVVGSWLFEGDFDSTVIRNWSEVESASPIPPSASPVSGTGLAISADGRAVVGESPFFGAFRWHETEGVAVSLGDLPGGAVVATPWDVSGDGLVVVGASDVSTGCQPLLTGGSTSGCRAFVWDVVTLMRPLRDVLVNDYGLELTGWTLTQATAISDDGRTLVGVGTNPSGQIEAWRVVLPPACDDGLDNDGDGLSDLADPGCSSTIDDSERMVFTCDNGLDDDGDGKRDFRADGSGDIGCRRPTWREDPQCQDGVSNDGDGLIDFDGGVSAGAPVPTAPDPQCTSFTDNREAPKPSCGIGFEVALALLAGKAWRRRRRAALAGRVVA
jgi:probable HAF family extracellular repeat protein